LALQAGTHRTYLDGIEWGECNLAFRSIHALEKALEVGLSELLSKQSR
jgi:hypothetical protein